MGGSLQDQLLKAGIASKQQARKAGAERRKHRKQQHKGAPQGADQAEQLQRAQADKAARDRELNLRKQEHARRRDIAAQIRQIIQSNRLPREGGETPYNFVDGDVVRRIHVSEDIHGQLVRGESFVVRFGDGFEVVPAAVADKLRGRDTAVVIAGSQSAEPKAEDDPYADYPVPDDLIW